MLNAMDMNVLMYVVEYVRNLCMLQENIDQAQDRQLTLNLSA